MLELPSERGAGLGAALGLLAVVAVLGVASFLVLSGGGFLSGGGQVMVAGGPSPSAAAGSSPPASGPGGPEQTDDGAAATQGGAPTATPAATKKPATGSTTRTAFTCDATGIVDPTKGSWRVAQFLWGARDGWDQVTFSLVREDDAARATRVNMEWLTPAQAARRFGVTKPVGARALVVTFQGPVYIRTDNLVSADLKAVRSIDVAMGDDEVLRAVIGVRGQGCSRLSSPAWTKPGTDEAAAIRLDVRYE